MKIAALILLATCAAMAQVAKKASATPTVAQAVKEAAATPTVPTLNGQPVRLSLATFYQIERDFDSKLEKLGDANTPIDMLGATRGVYLDGYGAVFIAEMSLVRAPSITPFHAAISKEEVERVHKQKVDRLPVLRNTMKEMVKSAARTLFLIPENQQIVFAVRLDYLQWENTSGLPGLVLMRADRKSALAGDIHHEEQ
jgi:hypothetical protein